MGMKNLTLSLDEDLLAKARVLAAMKRTSVNEMVREFLSVQVDSEGHQARRAEVWGSRFGEADANAHVRRKRKNGEGLFDRENFYEEVMRERRLL
jgi:plasmid stability protein